MLRLSSSIQGIPETITIHSDTVTIGRTLGSGARVCLQHPDCPGLLSRQHATVRLGSNGLLIVKDLGSMNGTFVALGPSQPASRIPAQQDWPLCHGGIVYFGARDHVVSKDGSESPNPFIYVYEDCSAPQGKEQQQAAEPAELCEHTSTAEQQPHSDPIRPPQQQQWQGHLPSHPILQQPQHLCPEAVQLTEASAAKRRRLSQAAEARVASASWHQQAAAMSEQCTTAAGQVTSLVPAAANGTPPKHSPPGRVLAGAAESGGGIHRHHHQQQHQLVVGSEPEVLQQLQHPLPPSLEPEQLQQQQQHPVAESQQLEGCGQHVAAEQLAPPTAETKTKSVKKQRTPATSRKAAAAAGKTAAHNGFSPLSPGMRVSVSTLECAICKDMMVAPHSLGCGHTFCGPCLQQWLEQPEPTCPSCRAPVKHAPILQRILDSIVSEAVLNQGSESQDRAARLEAWNAVKDVTAVHWTQRFTTSNSSQPNKPNNQANRQQTRRAPAAMDRIRVQQQQQPPQVPLGVVSLLPGRQHNATAAIAPAETAERQQNRRAGRRHSTRAAAGAGAARASGAAAAAAAVNRATGRPKSAQRARGRRSASARNSRGPGARPETATQQPTNDSRELQRLQSLQQEQRLQQQTRPRATRQQAIDGFLGHAPPVGGH